eukprot:10868123-Alexandrium_andersonii.AAC.1
MKRRPSLYTSVPPSLWSTECQRPPSLRPQKASCASEPPSLQPFSDAALQGCAFQRFGCDP